MRTRAIVRCRSVGWGRARGFAAEEEGAEEEEEEEAREGQRDGSRDGRGRGGGRERCALPMAAAAAAAAAAVAAWHRRASAPRRSARLARAAQLDQEVADRAEFAAMIMTVSARRRDSDSRQLPTGAARGGGGGESIAAAEFDRLIREARDNDSTRNSLRRWFSNRGAGNSGGGGRRMAVYLSNDDEFLAELADFQSRLGSVAREWK